MKKIAVLSVFAALLVSFTGCYGHGPLKDLRDGSADKKASAVEKKEVKADKKADPAAKAEKASAVKVVPAK